MSKLYQSESQLQSDCVIRFSQDRPDLRGHLIGYFATAESKSKGAMKNSLGLVRGVSDLLYVSDGKLIGIELKLPDSSHNRLHLIEQAQWLIKVPDKGYFCDNLDMFWDIINGGSGIDPRVILENCMKLKTETTRWNEKLLY